MIRNKKGLSDIVTTALIILLVAVAVAAIWAFVSPALRGTGTQFTKTQVCVSNIIEPITCKINGPVNSASAPNGAFPIEVQIRRTLTDGVAVPTEFETSMGTTSTNPVRLKTNDVDTTVLSPLPGATTTTSAVKIPKTQGELVTLIGDFVGGSVGTSPQTQVTTTYRLPDNTIVKCPSLPITCNVA